MTVPERRQATAAAVLALPEHVLGEIIDGELIVSPRPAIPQIVCASALGGALLPPFQLGGAYGPGGWWILDAPELHLNDDVLVPDLAGWRHERMPQIPNDDFITQPPDWVCEVLSPSTSRHDRTKKLPIYARIGVLHLWLIDPLVHIIEVYQLHAEHWRLLSTHGGNETLRAAPFEAAEVRLENLWVA